LKVGSLIRALQLDTEVRAETKADSAVCASACAYVFAGGVNRYYDGMSGKLGLHQFSSVQPDAAKAGDEQLVSGLLVAYLRSMGIDTNAFSISTIARSNDMVWLDANDAEALGLANNGALPTTAEIRTIGMQPYLRLEQIRRQGSARVLLTCSRDYMDLKAGAVATAKEAGFHSAISVRSYIELDGAKVLIEGMGGTQVHGDVLWLQRQLNDAVLAKLLRSKELGIWTEGGGAVRWGALIELRSVRTKVAAFVADCRKS